MPNNLDQDTRDILIRIDERTEAMASAFEKHVEQDREDFKDVHGRINKISGRQNWVIGVGSGVGMIFAGVVAWLKNSGGGGGP